MTTMLPWSPVDQTLKVPLSTQALGKISFRSLFSAAKWQRRNCARNIYISTEPVAAKLYFCCRVWFAHKSQTVVVCSCQIGSSRRREGKNTLLPLCVKIPFLRLPRNGNRGEKVSAWGVKGGRGIGAAGSFL